MPPENKPVVRAVQEEFGLFAAINVVARGELYGGKICAALSEEDRQFLMGLTSGEPDWSLYPLAGLEHMSAIKWKLLNIQRLRKGNPDKLGDMLAALHDQFGVDM